jgi:activating signal cointegrator complex subunit 2
VPDDWEFLVLQTKADLLDAFHILLAALLDSLAALPPGPLLASEAERTCDIVEALHTLPAPARPDDPTSSLNHSLLADYQHAYDLSEMLALQRTMRVSKGCRLRFASSMPTLPMAVRLLAQRKCVPSSMSPASSFPR